MEPQSFDPKTHDTPPAVAGEIPSAVSTTGQKRWLPVAGLVGTALVGTWILQSPRSTQAADENKNQSATPASSQSPALWPPQQTPNVSLESPSSYATPEAPASEARYSSYSYAEDLALKDARQKSPMVIFNNSNPARGGAGGGEEDPSVTTIAAGIANPSNGGAPLPGHFAPSRANSAHSTEFGDREFIITQGKLLDAVLETSINSDHPGMLRAFVSNNIYGDTGRSVLLPRGTRLVGQYDSAIAKGQNRVFVFWQRAIRPDGIAIELASAGTDPLGGTGVRGRVNNHFFTMFGAATLLSLIGATASIVGVGATDQPNSLAELRNATTKGFTEASNTVLSEYARIKPTITVKQGMSIKVFVAKDLYFDGASLTRQEGVRIIP